MECFTESFVRDVIIPEIERTGGATVSVARGSVYPHLDTPDTVYREYVLCGFPGTSTYYVERRGKLDTRLAAAANWQMDVNELGDYAGMGFWLHDGVIHVDYVETYTLHAMAVQRAQECGIDTLHRIHGMPYGLCCESVPLLTTVAV